MVLNDIINQAASRGSSLAERNRKSSRKVSAYLSSSLNDEDEEGPNLKERLTAAMYKFIDIFCVWDCCQAYIKMAEVQLGRGLPLQSSPINHFAIFSTWRC